MRSGRYFGRLNGRSQQKEIAHTPHFVAVVLAGDKTLDALLSFPDLLLSFLMPRPD